MKSPEDYLRQVEEEERRRAEQERRKERRREQPRKKSWVKRILSILLIGLLVLIIGAAWFGFRTISGVSSQPFALGGLAADSGGRTNVLILGVGDPGHAGQNLSDSIMVVSFNPSTKQVATTSIPRDTEAVIPGYGARKINNANALGGTALASETVSNMLDIPIHYTVTTNFSGLSQLVDAVGGLDVDVKEALIDNEYPCASNEYASCGINIQPGLQHMDGARVLEYTRCRKGTCGNDFGRAARQQEVIGLLMVELTKPSLWLNPMKSTAVSNALRTGIDTDLSGANMARLALQWSRKQGEVIRWVLSIAPGGFLRSDGTGNLVPATGNYRAIQAQAANLFSDPPPQDAPEL